MSAQTHDRALPSAGWIRRTASRAADNGLIVWFAIAVLVVVSAQQSDLFLTERNIANSLGQMTVLGLVTLGQTFVILAGAIDLSVGSMVGLANVLTAGLIDGQPARVVPVVLLVVGVGAVVGLINGLLSTRLRVPPIIVTLGTFSVLEGVSFAYTTVPVGSVTTGMAEAAFATLGPFPYLFIGFALLAGVAAWVLRSTIFGRRIYAVGGDPEIARKAGVASDRVIVLTMMVCSSFAAMGGIVQAMRAGVGTPTAGQGLELASITAVVVGGASLFGGRGRIIGSLGGAVLLALIDNSLNLLRVSSFSQGLVRGLVIVAAVAIFIRKD